MQWLCLFGLKIWLWIHTIPETSLWLVFRIKRKTLFDARPKPHLKLACNLADYTCNLVDYTCNPADYTCKPGDYTCKLVVYTCKVLNFRFTSVTLTTLLDTVEVTPFFSQFSGKLHVICCKPLVYACKLPVYNWNCQFTVKHHFTSCKDLTWS